MLKLDVLRTHKIHAKFHEHADMLMTLRLMSEHAEFQVPGPLWSVLVNAIDRIMGLTIFLSS